ncbi:glycosyltransferase family 4 protein [Adhaeribacter swui]|uniref:Glycosyltransferase family 4 protein n=1 Tax=Adhaeribacter swui TaxID=2086471 RepID=A0A7G7G3E7_9BACT|nr:glycosyltransferase family 4 protein [Adhaeribacter swui]QNF31681.1 glycosyltransferase family 4 protein [Adhaeribacter swui]
MRIAIVINTSWNIYNFRLNLIKALQAAGHEVVAIAPPDAYSPRLEAAGCRYVPILMENKGTNPVQDMLLIKRFYAVYRQVQPDVILQYTIKPNIYGTLAARLAGIPTVNNVSGLGTVFIVRNLVSKVALSLYRLAFRFPVKVFFQNPDDRELFFHYKLVKSSITDVLPGSGINTRQFVPAPVFTRQQPFTFLMIGRVLYEKGVVEFVEASKLLKQKYPEVRCQLLGSFDEAGNVGIKKTTFMAWVNEGAIAYLGTSEDVASCILKTDCVVLPSYREGTPKTLLEAAALGKPIITTNVPGCKETVIDGQNGLLCEARNATDLAAKMEQIYLLPDQELKRMGAASRQLAVTKFDEQFVIDKYLTVVNSVAVKVR